VKVSAGASEGRVLLYAAVLVILRYLLVMR
jgi:hypothetical protein